MSDTNEQNPELEAKVAELIASNAADIIAAIPTIEDKELLAAALVAEQTAEKPRVTVVKALTSALEPEEPAIEFVQMVRAEPQHEGGPVSAQVHPDEVDNYSAGGWNKA